MSKLDTLKAKIAVAEAELRLAAALAAAVVNDVVAAASDAVTTAPDKYGGQARYGTPIQEERTKERREQLKEDHAAWMRGEGA